MDVPPLPGHLLSMSASLDKPRKVLLASPRGFCAGVDRAVLTVSKALELYGPPVYVRNEIVHNKHVVDGFKARGVIFVDDLDLVPPGSLVVLSAHGSSPAVHAQASSLGLRTFDATCPLVTKVHAEAKRFANSGKDIVLVGHAGHEEVEGTMGQVPGKITLVEDEAQAHALEVDDPANLVWLSQTTLSVDETDRVVGALKQRFPLLQSPPSDDICYATSNRQEAVKAIAPASDLVVVVGSANSSNSVRLLEVALAAGAPAAYRVDSASELDLALLEGVSTVGLTSGASVPEDLVDGVLDLLAGAGFSAVEVVQTSTESLLFSLPPQLRKDLGLNDHLAG